LIGADELARMKPTARLINIARGTMVDEAALIEALRAGRIAGACLDVFEREPLPQNSPLWELPNVYVSPHSSSGWTRGLRERQKRLFLDNLVRFTQGLPLAGVVNVDRGY
jgi:phosphoglycerate dehydrogenase-like enzyme